MAASLPNPSRRAIGAAAAALVLAALSACMASQPGRVPDSTLGFDRTFDAALGALIDQKLVVAEQDRRQGTIDAKAGKAGISVALVSMPDGTIRVLFQPTGEADPALLQRVTDSYNQRMSGLTLLPGFRP